MLTFILQMACNPTSPDPYGNGRYDTATDSIDSAVDELDTDDTQDPVDTQDTEDTQETDEPVDPNAIEILGLYNHQGNEHYVGETAYSINYGAGEIYSYTYIQFSNPQRWLVAQNGSMNYGEENLYSRFDWNIDASGIIWICHSTATAETAQEAQNTPAANAFNTVSGCAGGPWVQLTG